MELIIVSPYGKYKDDEIYSSILHFCINEDKTPSGFVVGYNLDLERAALDMYQLAELHGKLKGTRIRHMILSFHPEKEPHIDYYTAYLIADCVCRYYEDDYQMVAAVHEDTDHVHVHIVMNTVRICDGEKYKGRKKDFYAFQNHIKHVIRPWNLKLKISY